MPENTVELIKLVLSEVKETRGAIADVQKSVSDFKDYNYKEHKEMMGYFSALRERTGRLEIKSGLWGTLGGIVAIAFAAVVGYVKGIF